MIKLQSDACCTNHKAEHNCVQQNEVCADFALATSFANEFVTPQLSDVSTSTRIASRRITKTSRSISTGKQISFVQSSTVTTTWSGSRPGIEGLPVDNDGHAVLGFDFFDKIPTSSDLFGWINNLDALIKNQNIGLQKEQVRSNYSSTADGCCGNDVSAIHNSLNYEACEENNQHPATKDCATGSELFHVGHFASFSQMGSIK